MKNEKTKHKGTIVHNTGPGIYMENDRGNGYIKCSHIRISS